MLKVSHLKILTLLSNIMSCGFIITWRDSRQTICVMVMNVLNIVDSQCVTDMIVSNRAKKWKCRVS